MDLREPVGIAIIGMSGRFPGAAGIGAFWDNLCAGADSIRRLRPDELSDAFEAEVRGRPDFVAARGIVDGADMFDAAFFGMHAREAALTDPQHRIFLECAWEAMEDAGYDPAAYAGSIGVIAGTSINTYMLRNVLADRAAVERFTTDYQVASYPELLGGGLDFVATRVAYKLNLRGPALTVQTACSTSLVAVAQACQALLLRQADMMLAGGVSISFPQERGYLHQAGGIVSGDGRCRPFDAQASGTVFGGGAGTVLLKRLDDALADRDTIYAVIRGFGVNNDGAAKAGYMAPSSNGQAAAIGAAHAMSGFDARTIRYVECHGTATPLGDPIEVAALVKAFPTAVDGVAYCALGSVKGNIGHLDIAAGITGLIKTALCLRNAKLPATLHYTRANPDIPFAGSPFFVNAELRDWPAGGEPRRAGVSAFGVGGTNVHVVLEAAPEGPLPPATAGCELVVLSARSAAALDAARLRLADHLRTKPHARLSDVAFTLQSGRRAFPHRAAITATSIGDATSRLATSAVASRAAAVAPGVGFLFPGQGAQYAGMGRGLYERFADFRATVDRCAEILVPLIGADLRDLLYSGPAPAPGTVALTDTAFAQPAIFVVEYALAQLWQSWGIVPAAMIGHSVGEFVAATIAGVFSLEDALALIAERGRLMQTIARGAMLAVRMPGAELQALLVAPLGLAAANSPKLSVAAGPFDAVGALETQLTERGITFRRLETSHAFHSSMMDAAIAPLTARVAKMRLSPPRIPYVSGISGDWITDVEATSADYWAAHCRRTVQFATGIGTLLERVTTLVEVGPGTTLATFAKQSVGKPAGAVIVTSLPGPRDESDDVATMFAALGRLWCGGARPHWPALSGAAPPARLSLPTYPFERARHWIDIPATHERIATPLETTLQHTTASQPVPDDAHLARVQRDVIALLEELSGETIAAADSRTTFLELGFDSLFLGRFVQRLTSRFNVALTFRQLLGDLPTIAAVSERVAALCPPQTAPAAAPAVEQNALVAPTLSAQSPVFAAAPIASFGAPSTQTPSGPAVSALESIVRDQLAAMAQLMQQQLAAATGFTAQTPPASPANVIPAPAPEPVSALPLKVAAAVPKTAEAPSRFEVFRPGSAGARTDLTAAQRGHIDALVARVTARTPRSKALTQRYRDVLADPRVAAGFRSEWKEMVYPIACDRAKGSRLWDVDGNEYIDILNGFGQTAFGHSPDFVVEAIGNQMRLGFPIGPQTELAGQVAELFCELTGNERVTFCNTGSEAVMAALRLARTVTGRNSVVVFNGAYHGQFDEVLVKGSRTSERGLPVAPGIPKESVANMIVLPYADRASLEWVREHANELAAVVVEPVQSRHPDLQPQEFLTEIRAITAASGTAFVFDEVVTGFRMHPGGMQHVFGIRADLATYGKVVGGGMPIGILAGNRRFMDALDGGMWQYGDDSMPEVAPTFFAGTFVRHPLVMSAVLAVLQHLKAAGPALQTALATRTADMVGRINADLARREITGRIETYGSLFYFNFTAHERLASLLYYHMRLRGVYIQEGFPCFMTTAHTAADVEQIVSAFSDSLDELASVGIFTPDGVPQTANASLTPAPPREIGLTEEQTEIWLAAQLSDAASCAFNESLTLRFDGTLDAPAFTAAWNAIVARHDALRMTFAPTGETMTAAAAPELRYRFTDVSAETAGVAAARFMAATASDAATAFDLIAGPPVRAHLFRLSAETHAFIFTAHHIVCDGWSMNVILTDFRELYTAGCAGKSAVLNRAPQFSAYAQTPPDAGRLAKVEAFWLAAFAEQVPALDLPADRPRPSVKTFRGSTRSALVDAVACKAVKIAGARSGCTLFVTLLSAFNALVGRLADTNDVVVGVPAAGQSLLDDGGLVGHCVDFLPIRGRWTTKTSFSDLLVSMKTGVLDAYEHQEYTLGTLVRKLALPRELNRLPLAEIQFNLERMDGTFALPGLHAELVPNPKAFVNFDLFLNVIESEAGLRLDCDYNSDIFDAATIDRWLEEYRLILKAIVADPNSPVMPAQAAATVATALSLCVDTAADYPRDATVVSLVAAQAARRPHAVAMTCGDDTLTYATLDGRSNALAQHLLGRVGTTKARIGIGVARSLDMVVALLATLKAGYAYVPLDPTHPPARLQHILRDANVAAMIVDGSVDIELVPEGIPLVHLERDGDAIASAGYGAPRLAPNPEDTAYVIYTSGSTGTPKGVEITHRALVNFLCSMAREPGFGPADTLVAVTTIAFDIAGLELFVPLIAGGRVALATDEQTRDGAALRALLESSRSTALQATPSTWRMLLEAGFSSPPDFKMLCGGEALHRDLADRLLEGQGELWNMYGPTETTIWSACMRIVRNTPILVGRPIANTQFAILDETDRLVPLGETGQLHIGGDGVARGYVARPELTAEKFIANPFSGGRLYRTGDSARMHAGGRVEILGRIDDQIKLRGFRIELGEIETTLTRHAKLSAAAVALREDASGQPRLVAYYVERVNAPASAADLRAIVARHLPEYMIPTAWMRLDALPLNTNGKLDRAGLPPLDETDGSPREFLAPRSATEIALAEIWAEVLKRAQIATDDDIFALGADSIQIFQITARANRQGIPILAKHLMQQRTLGNLAAYADCSTAGAVPASRFAQRRPFIDAARLTSVHE